MEKGCTLSEVSDSNREAKSQPTSLKRYLNLIEQKIIYS